MRKRSGLLCLPAALLAAFVTGSPARTESFPSHPIKVVLPYGAGGGIDAMLRLVVQKVADTCACQVVVENRSGAGGTVGAASVKTSPPDGYTLLVGDHATLAANVALVKNLPYDPVKDFQPLTMVFLAVPTLLVSAKVPATNVKELVEVARTRPGGLNYASQGVGSGGHLIGAMFAKAAGVTMTHVPYRSGADARSDLLAGRVDFVFNNYIAFRGDVEAGTVRALAVSDKQRMTIAPAIPTMGEAGYPTIDLTTWFGLVAPAGLSPELTQTLHDMFARVIDSPEIVGKLADQGFTAKSMTPEAFAAKIKADGVIFGDLVRAVGASANQ